MMKWREVRGGSCLLLFSFFYDSCCWCFNIFVFLLQGFHDFNVVIACKVVIRRKIVFGYLQYLLSWYRREEDRKRRKKKKTLIEIYFKFISICFYLFYQIRFWLFWFFIYILYLFDNTKNLFVFVVNRHQIFFYFFYILFFQ
jgi:hypothetical protein